jgi:hypothetical protein
MTQQFYISSGAQHNLDPFPLSKGWEEVVECQRKNTTISACWLRSAQNHTIHSHVVFMQANGFLDSSIIPPTDCQPLGYLVCQHWLKTDAQQHCAFLTLYRNLNDIDDIATEAYNVSMHSHSLWTRSFWWNDKGSFRVHWELDRRFDHGSA